MKRTRHDADLADLFRGLPDDRAQLPRWGYVLEGRVGFRFADREESFKAGDANYVPPGPHTRALRRGEDRRGQPHRSAGATIPVVVGNLQATGAAMEAGR